MHLLDLYFSSREKEINLNKQFFFMQNYKIKNTIIGLLSIVFIVQFSACKKNNGQEIDGRTVKLIIFPPKPDTVTGSSYIVSGSIIAPGNLKVQDHGFVVTESGVPFPNIVSLGAGNKNGYVEAKVSTTSKITNDNIEFFVVLESGEYISSKEISYIPSAPFNVNIKSPSHSFIGMDEVFSCTINNNDVANLQIIGEGIRYWDTSSLNPIELKDESPILPNSSPTYVLNKSVPMSTLFAKGINYTYNLYFVVQDKTTNEIQVFYSVDDYFIAM